MGQYKDKTRKEWVYVFEYKKYKYAGRGFKDRRAAERGEEARRKSISLGIGVKHKSMDSILDTEVTNKYEALKAKYKECLGDPSYTIPDLVEEMMKDFDLPYKFSDITSIIKNRSKAGAKISARLRLIVFKNDNYSCRICGRKPPEVTLQADHITPVSKGGFTEERNLRTLCNMCNIGRSNTRLGVSC